MRERGRGKLGCREEGIHPLGSAPLLWRWASHLPAEGLVEGLGVGEAQSSALPGG